jgi:membrane-associated protease RseP (regulator of RpoE activity)
MFWLWLVILGWITYVTLKRSVPKETKAPLWLLWLVMMAPALIWTVWTLNYPQQRSALQSLVFGPAFLVLLVSLFFLVYRLLLQRGAPNSVPPLSPKSISQAAMSEPSSSRSDDVGLVPPPKPLNHEEETLVKQCFSWSDYFLQKIEYRLQAVICQGHLRSDPAQAYEQVSERMQARFGDRFLLLLQEDIAGKPFFALVPNPQAQPRSAERLSPTYAPEAQAGSAQSSRQRRSAHESLYRPGLALLLLGLTLASTTLVGVNLAGHKPSRILEDASLLQHGLPYALGLMSILGFHELGHFWMAQRYKLRTTLPYFIPVPGFLGTFGAFIQIRSPMPNRRVVFDVGIAGPILGLIVALPLLLWGLAHSQVLPTPTQGLSAVSVLDFNALDPQRSILVTLLSRAMLGSSLGADSVLDLHPVAIAGYLGLIVTAMNLMPVGQLDGGHVVHAMFGQRTGMIISQLTRLLVLGLAWSHREFLVWALLLLFIPAVDEPALNDVSELDSRRDALGLLSLTILVLIILPVPPLLGKFLLG